MGLWLRLFRWRRSSVPAEPVAREAESESPPQATATNTVTLPAEPYVFECQACGKVFEARRKHPACSECDSEDVALMSE